MSARSPDYKLSVVMDGKYYKVGVGWLNETGTISLEMEPFVVLPTGPKVKLMLIKKDFPTT